MLDLNLNVVRFREDVSGGITALTISVFLIMFVSVGMAVDFMRHETYRAELQDAVDRGVLAATAFDQTVAPEDTVRAYIKSTNYVPSDYDLKVLDKTNGDLRRIYADASYPMKTFFLKLVGIKEIGIEASGEAIEGVGQVEIAMVFDVSGSMSKTADGSTKSRLEVLREDAEDFVNDVFDRDSSGMTTVSLIPFAGGVNAGEVAFDHFVDTQIHDNSRCLEFAAGDYLVSTSPVANSLPHIQHFESNRKSPAPDSLMNWGGCPTNDQEVLYFSSNRDAVVSRVRGLKGHDYTATYDGMKWANMVLDPDFNTVTQKLVKAEKVDEKHSALPGAFHADGTKKYVVLMSDGNVGRRQMLKDGLYVTQEDFDHYLENRAQKSELYNAIEQSDARLLFQDACNAAKANGVIIFTIGFDIDAGSDAYTDLQSCATDNSKFFYVKGEKLSDAFDGIVSTVQKLRLSS